MTSYYCPVEGCDFGESSDKSLSAVQSHISAKADEAHEWDDLKAVVEAQGGDPGERPGPNGETGHLDTEEQHEDQPEASESEQDSTEDMDQADEYEQQFEQATEHKGEDEQDDAEQDTGQQSSRTSSGGLSPGLMVGLGVAAVAAVVLLSGSDEESDSEPVEVESEVVGEEDDAETPNVEEWT
ncbi:hypothetical protein VB773_01485 [Haloarculaceae archaeon H-GB2-1]|nr:hypothetical protein [Haloarculaceae archaeon H-GB1-1]MEA5406386.1 hypothetical protein [Haloarculaceae archaeon H-GB2-1]